VANFSHRLSASLDKQIVTMFFKYATLLAFATSAIAGVVQPGTYRITSVAGSSNTTARTFYLLDNPVWTSDEPNPGTSELWDVEDSENGSYTLRNQGSTGFAAYIPNPKGYIYTGLKASSFNIESAGNGEFVIKFTFDDLLWTVEELTIPGGYVYLHPADGKPKQRWIFTLINPNFAKNDYDERWELLQRIGRFLGRF